MSRVAAAVMIVNECMCVLKQQQVRQVRLREWPVFNNNENSPIRPFASRTLMAATTVANRQLMQLVPREGSFAGTTHLRWGTYDISRRLSTRRQGMQAIRIRPADMSIASCEESSLDQDGSEHIVLIEEQPTAPCDLTPPLFDMDATSQPSSSSSYPSSDEMPIFEID